ncbi:TIGR04282 family arsenosugar biosynthesis glycosyltransferase [Thiocystis violacea]|uniref:TIGR04282 family arsenosugar biosynthesis glycosyltransferase n=1 Tax=Thiocystis violacea TaxID=13725 RepID=UPI001904E5DD|nr:TIGR04282 family arsenosugar biosynthesis glycosyltransferase [Thiocystis violacea]MBK1716112.1 hypothetical protein [Thiocystis violacea]
MTAEATPGGTLILFAREPVAGQVKTRLIPALGAEGAARLYRRLLGIALRAGAATHGAHRQLWCAGAPAEGGECARLAEAHGFTWHRQSEGDLGTRMAAALAEALAFGDRAVLIGSDCPDYDAAYLSAAFAAMDDRDAVLGPAADGGYVLIGLRSPAPEAFAGIHWSSPAVLTETRAALRRIGLTWTELPTLRDLDLPEDLIEVADLLDTHRQLD